MFLRNFIFHAKDFLQKAESRFLDITFGNRSLPGFCPIIAIEHSHEKYVIKAPNHNSILEDAFLFAVPKTRRTLEKRRNRKFGWPQYVWKPYVPKTNILMCNNCGHDYEAGHLCAHCYKQVKLETEEMQNAIQKELQLDPVDKEVVVLYEGEAAHKPEEFWKGKRIVEMKKPRPAWFSSNLLQKSTSDSLPENKNIKPPPDLA